MRILHVVTLVDEHASYGGPLTVAINQCRELRRQGHDAQILAGWRGKADPPAELEGVPAHLFPVRKVLPGMRFSSLFSRPMLSWLRREAPAFDAAHLHLARDLVPLLAGVVLRRCRVPYVSQTHGMVLPDNRTIARLIDRLLTLRVLHRATTRFVLTRQEDGALVTLLSPLVSTQRLPNGISIDLRAAHADVPLAAGKELDVVFIARLHPRKRVMDFAHAARSLLLEDCAARFTVIGPDDGDLHALSGFIAAHGSELSGRLSYQGALPHHLSAARSRAADVFVLPSVDEPFPMTLLEALAAGTPCICTSSCGVAEVLRADGAALVVDPGPDALAQGMRALLASPRRRAALSSAGPRTVKTHFSIDAVAGQLLVAYRQEQEVFA